MKAKLSSLFLFAVLSFFPLIISCQSAAAQKTANPPHRMLFVNVNDDNAALSRPRIIRTSASQSPAANKLINGGTANAARSGYEHRIFELINRKRMEAGLQPLIWNEEVAGIARNHSENMANYKFFNHLGIDGSMVNNRADAAGLRKWRSIGENIAYNRGYAEPLEFAVEGWMKSAAHRENILNNQWQESGIGIAITSDGTYYFTQVFLLRK